MPNKKNPYAEFENYTNRLTVETTFGPGDVRDHRDGFSQREYKRNQQDDSAKKEPMAGFPPMESVTQPSKPKAGTKQVTRRKDSPADDNKLKEANNKDLKSRNIK